MLAFFHAVARRLYPLRLALWLFAAACLVFFAVTVFGFGPAPGGDELMVSVVALLWVLSALTVVHGFHQPLPRAPEGAPLMARVKVRLLRAFLWLMAVVVTLLTMSMLLVTVRALGIAMG